MKPKYIISINRSKNGQFFWSVKARNSKKVGSTGEPNKNKKHVVKMAIDLFLYRYLPPFDSIYGLWESPWSGDSHNRLLQDLTVKKTK